MIMPNKKLRAINVLSMQQQKITHKTIKLVFIASLLKASSTGVGNFINISWIKYSEVSRTRNVCYSVQWSISYFDVWLYMYDWQYSTKCKSEMFSCNCKQKLKTLLSVESHRNNQFTLTDLYILNATI